MSQWSSQYGVANGIRLHYHRTGNSNSAKPALVLAHGITDNGLCWTRLAQRLEDQFDVIMVDARGHGNSDRPEHGYSAADHAADLAGLIEALGVDKPALLGHSMGGRSVAQLAADYPDVPSCIVLEDPAWFEAEHHEHKAEREQRMLQWRDSLLAQQEMSKEAVIAKGKAENPDWAEAEFGPWAEAKLEAWAEVLLKSSFQGDWTEIVKKIACPTLLVTAESSKGAIISADLAQRAAQLNPQLQTAHIRAAGHSIRREQFEAFVRAVEAFLGAHC